MENALAIYDDLLNANIPIFPDEVMHAVNAVEWSKSMQLRSKTTTNTAMIPNGYTRGRFAGQVALPSRPQRFPAEEH
jgi:hypothetical protein